MSEKNYYNEIEAYEEIERWRDQEKNARDECRKNGDKEGIADHGERMVCYDRVLDFLRWKTSISTRLFKRW